MRKMDHFQAIVCRGVLMLITLLSAYVATAQSPPQILFQLIPDGLDTHLRRWVYIEGDEFDYPSLNYDFWLDSYPWGRSLIGNGELQYYSPGPDNIEITDGMLRLKATNNPVIESVVPYLSGDIILSDGQPNERLFDYRSGMVCTKAKYEHGLYWASMKTPSGRGTWPAFWLYGGGPNEEFDIFEGKGERPNNYHVDVHCPAGCENSGYWLNINGNITQSFNSYFGEWGPNAVFWYFNNSDAGGKLATLNNHAHLILNLAISGQCSCPCCWPSLCTHCSCSSNPPFCPGPDNSTNFPQYFDIDFVRIYQIFDCTGDKIICSHSQQIESSEVLTARNLTIGGGCTAIVSPNQRLTAIGSESVTLLPGADLRHGSRFDMRIVPCYDIGDPQGILLEEAAVWDDLEPKSMIGNQEGMIVESGHEYSGDDSSHKKASIHPNPISLGQSVNLYNLPEYTQDDAWLAMHDAIGKLVYYQHRTGATEDRIDTEGIAPGVYIVTAGDTRSVLHIGRIIIQ